MWRDINQSLYIVRVVESSLCKSTGCGLQSIAVELCHQTKKQHLFSVTPSFTSARSSDRDDYCRGNRFHIHLCKIKITIPLHKSVGDSVFQGIGLRSKHLSVSFLRRHWGLTFTFILSEITYNFFLRVFVPLWSILRNSLPFWPWMWSIMSLSLLFPRRHTSRTVKKFE